MIKRLANRWLWLLASLALVFSGAASACSGTTAGAAQPMTPGARLCADVSTGQVSLKIAGDSIMTHAGASTQARGWPQLLQSTTAPKGWTVDTTPAVAGSKASDFVAGGQFASTITAIAAAHPTLVTLDWRTNEQWVPAPGVTPETLRTQYLAIIDTIRTESPSTSILVINPPKMALDDQGGIDNYTVYTQAQYRAAMYDAAVLRGALWLDFSDPAFWPTGGALSRQLLPDGIHPGDAGHVVFASTVYAFLRATCGS